MTATDPASQDGRTAIVAGSGALPRELYRRLKDANEQPFLVAIRGQADTDLQDTADRVADIEEIGKLPGLLRRAGVRRLVLAGGVSRRPDWRRFRPTFGVLRALPKAIRALGAGDDALLRVATGFFEQEGIAVVGAHKLMPELLTPDGVIGRHAPQADDWEAIRAGWTAAKAIGGLDIGQAAIAFGSRAVALEGIEGTEGLLERTRELRDHGRLSTTRRGVLVKCAKPGQDLRTDLPSIGPQTVTSAHAAGLCGIAVEAGLSLILELEQVRAESDRLGLFVIGIREGMLP